MCCFVGGCFNLMCCIRYIKRCVIISSVVVIYLLISNSGLISDSIWYVVKYIPLLGNIHHESQHQHQPRKSHHSRMDDRSNEYHRKDYYRHQESYQERKDDFSISDFLPLETIGFVFSILSNLLFNIFVVLIIYLIFRVLFRSIIRHNRRKRIVKIFEYFDFLLYKFFFVFVLNYKENRNRESGEPERRRLLSEINNLRKNKTEENNREEIYEKLLSEQKNKLEISFKKKREKMERKKKLLISEYSHILEDKETELTKLRSDLRESKNKTTFLENNQKSLKKNEENKKLLLRFHGAINEEELEKNDNDVVPKNKETLQKWIEKNNQIVKNVQEEWMKINNKLQTQIIMLEKKEEVACPICFEGETNYCLSPCGHLLCEGCKDLVEICPICRKEIKERIRKYE